MSQSVEAARMGGGLRSPAGADEERALLGPFRMNWLVFLEEWGRGTLRDPFQHFTHRIRRHCTVCGFKGFFIRANGRPDRRCPNCSSRERDRRMALYMLRNKISVDGKSILHLSPERCVWRKWRRAPNYVSGDVKKSRVANTYVDVTDIQFPDKHFDFIFCNHVLEHVAEDRKGMRECARVLKPDGLAVFSVPLLVNGDATYEPPDSMPKREVERICGWDHKRVYGDDFVDRLREAGFEATEIMSTPEEDERYRITNVTRTNRSAHRVFIARRIASDGTASARRKI